METTNPLYRHEYLGGCHVLKRSGARIHSVGCGKHQYCVDGEKECRHFYSFSTEIHYPRVLCFHKEPQEQGNVTVKKGRDYHGQSIEVD